MPSRKSLGFRSSEIQFGGEIETDELLQNIATPPMLCNNPVHTYGSCACAGHATYNSVSPRPMSV